MVTGAEHLSMDWTLWGVTIVSGLGKDGFPPEREGGVLEDRSCGGGLEDMRNSGELLTKAERDPT